MGLIKVSIKLTIRQRQTFLNHKNVSQKWIWFKDVHRLSKIIKFGVYCAKADRYYKNTHTVMHSVGTFILS